MSLMGTAAFSTDASDAARQLLEADRSALLVIDVQERLLPPIFNKVSLVKNTRLLIRLAKILALPILLSTQYKKGLGDIVPDVALLLEDVRPIDKVEFSCFGSDSFRSAIKALPRQRNTVLLCGMEAHICVMQTALGALSDGYLVHVVSDAVGSRTEANWKVGLDRLRAAGAVISSTEMMIYELLRCSGTAQFKELLPHLKA